MDSSFALSGWSLSDLYPGFAAPETQAAFAEAEGLAAGFEARRADLSPAIHPKTFLQLIRQLEELQRLLRQLYAYAYLAFSANTQDQEAQNFQARVQQFTAEQQNRTLFFELWWKALDDAAATRLMESAGAYRYWLEELRHFKPHTLSEQEEKIINIKDVTGSSALKTLYDTITNRYVYRITVDGEPRELTRGELMVCTRHPDPTLRAAAYQELCRVYSADSSILGQIYQALMRDWHNEQIGLRRFTSPIAARNLLNDIPDAVVDTLLQVCCQNAGLFQRFFRLKARWLGMERLRRYDVYAPVVKADKPYDFTTAAGLVFESYQGFDAQVAELARRVCEVNHLDSEVRKGKRSGAFCYSVTPQLAPWVLMNFQGRVDDVATLAHELGHAVHALLAASHTLFTWHSSLPLAETASLFGEMLLVERLLKDESDPAVRRDLLFRQMDDAYATILRQAFFALFERRAHEMIQSGASIDDLAEAYCENLQEQFGAAVEIGAEFRWEWVSIPHIYRTPFYVYAYAFGQLLVLSLYQQYKEEGQAFKPRYLKILAAGGSAAPIDILSEAGIDIRSAAFWQGGFAVLQALLEQLEAIPLPGPAFTA